MNAAQFLRGAKDVDGAFEEVADSLDKVARDSRTAADKMGSEFKSAGKNVEASNERVERSFKELADIAKRETRQAGDDIGKNVKRGTDQANEGVKEIGREAASTAKESAASFDGSADSIADAFQEVAANAFAGFGPAGLIAGLAAAAGIGIISNALQSGTAEGEKLKETVSELTAELIDAGKEGGPSLDYMVNKLKELAGVTEDSETSLSDLADAADKAGLPFDKIARAYVGNSKALKDLIRANEEHAASLRDEANALNAGIDDYSTKYSKIENQAKATEELNNTLRTNLTVTQAAEKAEAEYLRSGAPAMDAKREQVDAINDAYDEAAGAVSDYVDAESGVFNVQAYIDAMRRKQEALAEYQETLATSALSSEAKSFLAEQGADAAAQFLAGYKSAAPAQQAELDAIWSESGRQNSNVYGTTVRDALATAFGGMTIPGPNVAAKVVVDRSALDKVLRETLTLTINTINKIGKATP